MSKFNKRFSEFFISFPSTAWLLIFFVIPTIIVLAMSFRAADMYGGIGDEWTLKTLTELRNPNYPAIIWRTVWISVIATFTCVILSVPAGYYIARMEKKRRDIMLLFIIVPFWVNFLIRIFAWKVFLHPEGYFKKVLVFFHIVSDNTLLLYNSWAVLVVVIYTYLPFALLPIYAAAEKFDFYLLEAAYDLGASKLKAFIKVFIPGIRDALFAAILVVFIPALGSYVIPEIVGGPSTDMIGNKIAQRTFVERNLPHASALSTLLVLSVLLPVMLYLIFQNKRESSFLKGGISEKK